MMPRLLEKHIPWPSEEIESIQGGNAQLVDKWLNNREHP